MTRKYFGTDGIRGQANTPPMTAELALKVAMATVHVLHKKNNLEQTNKVVVGKDTRLSGYMLEQAMASGFVSMGMDVVLTGPVPTPAIAMLTRSLRADLGIVISASHNPYQDNGIKIFGPDGYKLSDALEEEIEEVLASPLDNILPGPDVIGKANRLDDAAGRYIEHVKKSIPEDISLSGLKIVIDCAHGAAYKVAPQILQELEADVVCIGIDPDGRNINDGVGATHTDLLERTVLEENADIGIALDGDADRLIVVDEKGQRVDGDQLMGMLAISMQQMGTLQSGLVCTVMSNLGLEKLLRSKDIPFFRTSVGDRYVVEAMREQKSNLGGEQSGHIILGDIGTTGDGMLAALQILAIIQKENKPASEACSVFTPMPQILRNICYQDSFPLDNKDVVVAIQKAEQTLSNDGRLLVRPSGTENVIRVMAEGENMEFITSVVDDLCTVVERAV